MTIMSSEDEYVRLTVAEVDSLGGAAPVQGYGRLSDGRHFYFRVRHTQATLWAGPGPYEEHYTEGRTVGMTAGGVDDDPHIWSSFPTDLHRPILDFLVWMLGDAEYHEAHPLVMPWGK